MDTVVKNFFEVAGLFRIRVFAIRRDVATKGRAGISDMQTVLDLLWKLEEFLGGLVCAVDQVLGDAMVLDVEETN